MTKMIEAFTDFIVIKYLGALESHSFYCIVRI